MLTINQPPNRLPMETIEEVKGLSTCLLSDAMAGLGTIDYGIKGIVPGMNVAGTAFTVNLTDGNAMALIAAAALAGQGHVLVISGKGDTPKAVLGDLILQTISESGIDGVVVDGLVRDVGELRKMGIPLFALGAVPTAIGKKGSGEINGPICCGGIVVNPGDLIVGDDDGVVVVPRDKIDTVIGLAKAKRIVEAQRTQDIQNGFLMPAWLEKQIADMKLEA